MHLRVINRPESMEVQHLLIPSSGGFHVLVRLVSNAMIDLKQMRVSHEIVENFGLLVSLVARQEGALVAISLDESVNSVTIGLNGGNNNSAELVSQLFRSRHTLGASGNSLVVDSTSIIDSESNISDTITVSGLMSRHLSVVSQRGFENEVDVILLNNMGADRSLTGFQTLVSNIVETESGSVEGGGLLGVSNPENAVIESREDTNFRSFGGLFVTGHGLNLSG
mmetsp:Transcript_30911/g.35210  ORF Transcript_30911/g.35210 Transcript_30911/m.35210 type:complete len:224 (-) Transcript_30911:67-738(-)